jgi:hypothetical protein
MRLIDELERLAAVEPSLFRAQLLREDVARLRKVDELARTSPDVETYARDARRLGWTAQDARTDELSGPLKELLDAVRDAKRNADADAAAEARVREAWTELTRVRMERLVGCLSMPVPKPVD